MADVPRCPQCLRPVENDGSCPVCRQGGGRLNYIGLAGMFTQFGQPLSAEKPLGMEEMAERLLRQTRAAELLAGIVEEESHPRRKSTRKPLIPHARYRMQLALVLLLAIFIGLIFPQLTAKLPSAQPAAFGSAVTLIDTLPQDAAVMLALEFEPAQLAEMLSVAQPLLTNLLQKNARIVWVTTHPAAALYAADLAGPARLAAGDFSRTPPEVAFLPGGTLSIRGLFQSPSGWTGRIEPQSSSGALRLSDIQLIIVLAGDGESGREWIEQSSQASSPPLLIGASAQAAPLLSPYFDSRQIGGLIAGAAQGNAYARRIGVDPSQADVWPGVRSGALAAFLLIAGGSLAALLPRRERRQACRPARRRG